jgi:hypothetical protein
MHLIERNRCAISGNDDLLPLNDFPLFPVFMGCVDQPEALDLKEDMVWVISQSSGLIQLKNLLPLDVLYPESHGSGAVGSIWKKHHKAFADFLHKSLPSAVLEIGGAHGILAMEYDRLSDVSWTILEPNPTPVDGCNARIIKGFFDENFKYSDCFDTVVHSHVFEHIYNPDDFMQHLSSFMSVGKRLVFSIPNMQEMLERKYNNCINFEHTFFLTEPYVEYLLARHGFKLQAKEYFMRDHSIFYCAVRDNDVKKLSLPQDLFKKNKKLYSDYTTYYHELIANLNLRLHQTTQPVYLFGAHVFAQYLIQMGLETKNIVNILDNDPSKQGKRLYGTHLIVDSPKVLRDLIAPAVILKAGVYNAEIKKDILENINSNVVFLE